MSRARRQRASDRLRLLACGGICAAVVALAGCGGSTSSSTVSSSAVAATGTATAPKGPVRPAHATPSESNPDVGGASAQNTPSAKRIRRATAGQAVRRDKVTKAGKIERAQPTPGSTNDDVNATGAQQLDPCTLVSVAEAETITHGQIKRRIEAPLGPTCIYEPARSHAQITLAIESMSFARVARQLARREHLSVAGRQAYCGHFGMQMLVVDLPQGQLLNVTGSCEVARQFAAAALHRLA
jgi:hypothetical protein